MSATEYLSDYGTNSIYGMSAISRSPVLAGQVEKKFSLCSFMSGGREGSVMGQTVPFLSRAAFQAALVTATECHCAMLAMNPDLHLKVADSGRDPEERLSNEEACWLAWTDC